MQGIIVVIQEKAPIRRANIGEYVEITEQSKASHINYATGDIIKITEITELGCVKGINQKDGKQTGCISKYEYVVLENYQPESKPEQPRAKYYNGKVVCVKNADGYTTVGKIYEIVHGRISYDNGKISSRYKTLEEINMVLSSKFIELVE